MPIIPSPDSPAPDDHFIGGSSAPRRAGFSLPASAWRPALSCVGALGIGLILAPLVLKPSAAPTDASAPLPEIVLPRDGTLLMTPTLPPGVLLRGSLQVVAGETDALGRAPVGGQVARQLVENGARVERGDAVMEISSGASVRSVPASEFRQSAAEKNQIAASDAQNALAEKISTAQVQLSAAQERVDRAQAQTAAARDVVRRLQNGQSVSSADIPAKRAASSDAPRPRRSRASRTTPRVSRAAQIASRQAQAAREAAQESAKSLQTARDMLLDTQNAARQADDKAQSSAQAVVEVEARFDAKKATGADVEAARIAQKEAQSLVNAADKALISAKTEVTKRESAAATAQGYAKTSADQADKALASASLEPSATTADSTPASTPAAPETAAPTRITLDQAIRFAGEALDESRRASRDAERINAQIENYQSQVKSSSSRIEAATQNLASAQQGVMDSVPRPRFTTSYAPAAGIVTWVSRLAREVNAGNSIFGVSSKQRVAAHFEDKTGLWRAIKPGSVLSAFVVDAPAAPAPIAPADSAPNSSVTMPTTNTQTAAPNVAASNLAAMGAGHQVEIKMTEVVAPASDAQSASLTGAIVKNAGGETAPAGTAILLSLPRPGQKATLSVPASALVQRGNATYVAVLAPLSAPEIAARSAAHLPQTPAGSNAQTPVVPQTATEAANTEAQNAGETFRLRWARVETGRSDGLRLEIVDGLSAGERIVSAPDDLEAMGFSPASETPPTATAPETATPSPAQKPEQPLDAGVLVRLTTA